MAIVHADNFSIYGTNLAYMLNGIYAQVPGGVGDKLTPDPDGISSGFVALVSGNGANETHGYRYVLPSAATKVGLALRTWFTQLPVSVDRVPCPLMWRDVGNTNIACVTVDTTGRLSARTGGHNGPVLQTTSSPVITANGWYHIEGVIDLTSGTFEVRVEGQSVIFVEDLNWASPEVYQTFIGTRATATSTLAAFYVKDFVIWNGDGSQNNDFLGSVLVHNLTTTSDVALNWGSTGANGYSILDNIPPDDDQYIFAEDSPLPAPYVATLSQLPPEVTSVKALISFVRAAKNDGGDGSLQTGIVSDPDGTPATALGVDRPITVAQIYWRDVFELDPKTSAAWLPDAVNNVNLQINRTT